MVVLNTQTRQVFENVSKVAAAKIVGVSESTIKRWSKDRNEEIYNSFHLFFKTNKLKQPKGKPKPPPKKVKVFRRP
jgi:transposase